MKKAFFIGSLIGIFLAVVMYSTGETYTIKEKTINLKDLYLYQLDGSNVDWSEFENEKVLVNFWGSHCPPCVDKLPYLNSFASNNPDFTVLSISGESLSQMNNYLDHFDYNNIKFTKMDGKYSSVGIYLLPTTILIQDGKGRIFPQEDLEKLIGLR